MGIRAKLSVAVLFATVAVSSGAHAASLQHGSGDWARMSYANQSDDSFTAAYLDVRFWGTDYYRGIPPMNQGGVGDGVACLSVQSDSPDASIHGTGCIDAPNVELDSLRSLTIQETFVLELTEGDGTPLGSETATLSVTLSGFGPVFPGARAATNASPGVELEYDLMRKAMTTGSVTSSSFGTIDLTGADAILQRVNCVGYALQDSDAVQACRF